MPHEGLKLIRYKVQEHVSQVRAIARSHSCGEFDFATNAQEKEALWSARKEALWSMLAMREEGEEVWSTDVAVPFSRLPDLIGGCHPNPYNQTGFVAHAR
jgi:D-lactate dehydrogenase (cytochrome)